MVLILVIVPGCSALIRLKEHRHSVFHEHEHAYFNKSLVIKLFLFIVNNLNSIFTTLERLELH